MSRKLTMIVVLIISAGLGFALSLVMQETASESADAKPLYWVAPMDPSYRRDKPGKSPMGMDLVPVYKKDGGAANQSTPGEVSIDPTVINNLGVRIAKVEKSPWLTQFDTVGYVTVDERQQVNITPRVAGWVEQLQTAAEGDPVSQGKPLYTLYSPEWVNAQREYLTALQQGDRAMRQASRERLRALQFPESAINELTQTHKIKQSITVMSPISGYVQQLGIRAGDYVKPGQLLFALAPLAEVWVEGDVFVRHANNVERGAKVEVTTEALPGRHWQGTVDYIYPSLDSAQHTVRVRVQLDNADHALKPNMYAHLHIQQMSQQPVLHVPREAVIRTGRQARVVMTDKQGHFKSVAVTTGRVSDQQIEITDGLHQGDAIVVSAQFLIDSESNLDSDLQRMSRHDQPMQMKGMKHNAHGTDNAMPTTDTMDEQHHNEHEQMTMPQHASDSAKAHDTMPAMAAPGGQHD